MTLNQVASKILSSDLLTAKTRKILEIALKMDRDHKLTCDRQGNLYIINDLGVGVQVFSNIESAILECVKIAKIENITSNDFKPLGELIDSTPLVEPVFYDKALTQIKEYTEISHQNN